MTRYLKNAEITHVSFVDKAANKKKFFLTKSEESPNFQTEVKVITKSDDPKQFVYGVVYEPEVEDAHEDAMTAEEIEKAAHKFMKSFRNIDEQHDFEAGAGELLESYIAPTDMQIGEETILKGSWVIVTKATDEIWEKIEKGEYTGYSMGGTAEVDTTKAAITQMNKNESPATYTSEDSSDDEVRGFFNTVKSFFSKNDIGREHVTKGEVREKHNERVRQNSFWSAWNVFENVMRSYDWRTDQYVFEQDPDKVKEAIKDLNDILSEILLIEEDIDIVKAFGKPPQEVISVQKAGRKMSAALIQKLEEALATLTDMKNAVTDQENDDDESEETEMNLEDIAKMLDDKLNPITNRLTELEKGDSSQTETPEDEKGKDGTQDDVLKQLGELLDQKLDPIEKRLTNVEKARSGSNQVGDNDSEVISTQKSYMKHFGN